MSEKIKNKQLRVIREHYQIYQEYCDMLKQVKDEMPTVAPFIAVSYYYNTIALRHNMSINYICTIVNNVAKHEKIYSQEIKLR